MCVARNQCVLSVYRETETQNMEELISGTGPGQKTTLLTGLWCLFVYSDFVKWCLIPTEWRNFKPSPATSSFQDFQNFPVWFLWHCRLVWRLQATVRLATPSSPSKLVPLCTSFLKHQILGGKSGFPCRILCFKRQFYMHQLPQWKYKLCELCGAAYFGRQLPRARERRDSRRMTQRLLPIPNDRYVCFNWHHAYRCWVLLTRILCACAKTLSRAS